MPDTSPPPSGSSPNLSNDGSSTLISVARGLHATTYIDRETLAILLVVRRYS